jgi:hypothetical protein
MYTTEYGHGGIRDAVGYGKTDALVKIMKMVGTRANGW